MNDIPSLGLEDGTPVFPSLPAPPSLLNAGMAAPLPDRTDFLRDTHLDRTSRLLERARARREKALTDRDMGLAARPPVADGKELCIVQTTTDGRTVVSHRFDQVPRLGDLIARTGPDVFVLCIRIQPPEH